MWVSQKIKTTVCTQLVCIWYWHMYSCAPFIFTPMSFYRRGHLPFRLAKISPQLSSQTGIFFFSPLRTWFWGWGRSQNANKEQQQQKKLDSAICRNPGNLPWSVAAVNRNNFHFESIVCKTAFHTMEFVFLSARVPTCYLVFYLFCAAIILAYKFNFIYFRFQ